MITLHANGTIEGLNNNNFRSSMPSGSVIGYEQNDIVAVTEFGANSSSYQDVTEQTYTIKSANSNLLVTFFLHGHFGGSTGDNNFKLLYKIGSGSYTTINFNSTNTSGSNGQNMFGNLRGDSVHNGDCMTSGVSMIDGTWSVGDVISAKIQYIGESGYKLNKAYSDGAAVRFGRSISKILFTEIKS